MTDNFPYISGDYFSEKYQPFELTLTNETLFKTEKEHFRNEIEYIFVSDGLGSIEINGAVVSIKKGDFIQLMPYHVHRFIFEKEESIQIVKIRFSIGLLLYTSTNKKNYLKSIQSLENSIPVVHLNERFQRRLAFIFEETNFDINEGKKGLETLYISLISFISYAYYYHYNQLIEEKEKQHLGGRMLQYIQFHHQEQLTINQVADVFSLGPEEVKEILYDLTGFSFTQLLNQVRIRNAVALTQFNELSINQIGKICGYQTDSAFYKQFKLLENKTPECYRQEIKGQEDIQSDAFEIFLFLMEYLCEPITINELAKKLNFSEKKINNRLKEAFNLNFHDFYTKLRIVAARNLLISMPLKVEEVALKMGFQDRLTFSRNFKKVFGVTPSQYKKTKEEDEILIFY